MFEEDLCSDELLLSVDHESLYALWAARFCGYKRFVDKLLSDKLRGRFDLSDLSGILHLDADNTDVPGVTRLLLQAQKLEQKLFAFNPGFNGVMKENLAKLQKAIGLTETDVLILGFYILLKSNSEFEDVMDSIGDLNRSQLIDVLSMVLAKSKKDISHSLSSQSLLPQSGLLKVDINRSCDISDKVDILDGLQDVLLEPSTDPIELLKRYFSFASKADLKIENFPHLKIESERVCAYLKKRRNRKGVNILIYGPPGTGKTEWIKAIAQSLNYPLFEITTEDNDGDSLHKGRRVELYKLAQFALQKRKNSLIIFDEVEDVFPHESFLFFSSRKGQSGNKGWLNKLLENNPVPAFWISNDINQIDPAYIRRFDLVVEVETPPRKVRLDIIQNELKGLNIDDEWMAQLAENKQLVPAVVARAAKVVKTITHAKEHAHEVQAHLENLINATLEAQGHAPLVMQSNEGVGYSLDLINTDVDIKRLVAGVQRSQRGRFCLYGLPGTGKTAFGNYLAKALDKPLIVKRASDLLSPYVGEAERNIAHAFKEAKREGAVLQIDEADSFLQSRENALRSWEVTQVNELLTQMETFDGVFIASTNLMDNIDQAAMRRFDLKLEFKPLTSEQALKMMEGIFRRHEIQHDDQTILAQLKNLNLLTPGDFSTVMRRFEISGQIPEPYALISALEQECQFKPGYRKTSGIGFLSTLSH